MIELISLEIPKAITRQTTLFDIAGFPHYETVMSNCYAYFLNKESGAELAGIFLDTILQLVVTKTGKQLSMESWDVQTEVQTKAGNRIDILVSGIDADHDKYIIIENKIYHYLNNDLTEYWEHCSGHDTCKIGIVLSLSPIHLNSTTGTHFINILHSEWTAAISSAPTLSALSQQTRLYLNEFTTALNNLKTDTTMNDQTRFYFQHIAKVKEVMDTHTAARQFTLNQFRLTAEGLDLILTGSAYGYRYFEVPNWPESNIFYTIMYDNFFTESRTIRVVIEIMQRVLDKEEEMNKIAFERIKTGNLLYKSKINPGHWVHYTGQDFTFSVDEIENLGLHLQNRIREHLHPIFIALLPLGGWSKK